MAEIFPMTHDHPRWAETIALAEGCSWRAGPVLASLMRDAQFLSWERVFCAVEGGRVVGFCTLTARDELPEKYDYTPFIGFVFVEEAARGHRISEQLLRGAEAYAAELGFDVLYIMSGEKGLYEKYGFRFLKELPTIYGGMDQLFVKELGQEGKGE